MKGDMAEYYENDLEYVEKEDFDNGFFQKPLNPKPIFHKCKDGKLVCLNYHNPHGEIPKMENSHLLNTIRFLERRAKKGVRIRYGGSGNTAEEMWYDEEYVYGKKALEHLNYNVYVQEAKTRKLI